MIFVLGILAMWTLGFVLLWRVPRCPEGSKANPASLSIIIPARNEEQNLQRLLGSIAQLTPSPDQVIVVDDSSTDRTAEVARSHGATVFTAPPLPSGWRGKAWACFQGAGQATSDLLLFLDADTVLKPDALARMHAARPPGPRGALSLGPYHDVEQPYEELSALFNLMTFMGMGSFSLTGRPDEPRGLFGPCLLIDRNSYESVDGHRAVRSEILEHMSLCEVLRAADVPMRCLGGRDVVHVRMYPDGFASLVEGWTKAFADGAAKTEPGTLALSVFWLTGGMFAFFCTLFSPLFAWLPAWTGVTYLAYAGALWWMLRSIGRFSPWFALGYPLLFFSFFAIFLRSATRRRSGKSVQWKGRTIAAKTETEAEV